MSSTGFVLEYTHTHTHTHTHTRTHTHTTHTHSISQDQAITQIFSLLEPLLSKHECLIFLLSHCEFLIDGVLSNTLTKVLILFFNSISDVHKEIENLGSAFSFRSNTSFWPNPIFCECLGSVRFFQKKLILLVNNNFWRIMWHWRLE